MPSDYFGASIPDGLLFFKKLTFDLLGNVIFAVGWRCDGWPRTPADYRQI